MGWPTWASPARTCSSRAAPTSRSSSSSGSATAGWRRPSRPIRRRQRLDGLAGLRLATSHPRATRESFERIGVPVELVTISGAVEVAPRLGLADGIVDLVSSGSTLVMNGLRSVGSLFSSQAVLVGPRSPDAEVAAAATELRTMIEAVIAGRGVKYLMMNAPVSALERIEAILPGLESPSVIPLAHEGMVAVHAVVRATEVRRHPRPPARGRCLGHPRRCPSRSSCHDRRPGPDAAPRPTRRPLAPTNAGA